MVEMKWDDTRTVLVGVFANSTLRSQLQPRGLFPTLQRSAASPDPSLLPQGGLQAPLGSPGPFPQKPGKAWGGLPANFEKTGFSEPGLPGPFRASRACQNNACGSFMAVERFCERFVDIPW